VEPGEAAPVHVNRELLQAYLRAADELRQQTGAKSELDLVSLLRLPGVIGGLAPTLPDSDEEQEALGKVLESLLAEAVSKMDEMRRTEGRHLTEELRARLVRISEQTEQVRGLVETLRPAFARRLESRLKDLLNGAQIDSGRLAQERRCWPSEATSAKSSTGCGATCSNSRNFWTARESSAKLDFLLQEMHREANTMLSKTPGVESEALAIITGLSLKSNRRSKNCAIQVQNIE